MKKPELQTMIVRELKALAGKMKVQVPSEARKADIIKLLSAAFKSKPAAKTVKKNAGAKHSVASVKKKAAPAKIAIARKKAAARPASLTKPALRPDKPSVEMPPAGREWKTPPGVEEPIMAQERVSDAKYYTGPERGPTAAAAYGELPAGYGEEKIAIMVRDPYLAYAYWEVTQERLQREKAWFGWDGKLTIRIYDVTGVQFDGRNAVGYFDQDVDELVGKWYFDLGRPGHSFIADIGLLSPEGRFLTLARSNRVITPRDGVSDVVDGEWIVVDEEYWKIYGLRGGPSSQQLHEKGRLKRRPQVTSPGMFPRGKK